MTSKRQRNSSADHPIFSGALNNQNYLSGGVDPQSGQFTFAITFGALLGDRSFGPDFELRMSFSAMATMSGSNARKLGVGWSFNLPAYDPDSELITLPDGQTFKVHEPGWYTDLETPWRTSRMLDDVRIYGLDGEERQVVIRTRAGEEYVLRCDSRGGYGTLQRYTAPDGRSLVFEQRDSGTTGQYILERITDHTGALLATMDDSVPRSPRVILYPGSGAERVFTLSLEGSKEHLTEVAIATGVAGEVVRTAFEYERRDVGGSEMLLITRVVKPSGAVEVVDYEASLPLPPDADIGEMPAVSRHTVINSLAIGPEVTTYEYGIEEELDLGQGEVHSRKDNNFFGHNCNNIDWDNAADSIANVTGFYEYTNKVVKGDKTTYYVYNKFHQQKIALEHYGNPARRRITRVRYYTDEYEDLPLASQDPRYNLQKSLSVIFEDRTEPSAVRRRALDVHHEYDVHGNRTFERRPDGTTVTTTHYAAGGEAGCPAHPFGMVGFVKETVTGPIAQTTGHEYQAIARIDGTGTFVVPARELHAGQVTTYTYCGQTGAPAAPHGLIHRKETANDGKTTTTGTGYEIDVVSGILTVTETTTGHDATQVVVREGRSVWTRNVTTEVNGDGVQTDYVYDALGRVMRETHAVGTEYASETSWTYVPIPELAEDLDGILEEIGYGWVIQERNDGERVATDTCYDGARRETRTYARHGDGRVWCTARTDYDVLGRESVVSELDHDLGPECDDRYVSTSSHVYGDWGTADETHQSDGTILHRTLDPFALQVTEKIVRAPHEPDAFPADLPATRTTYDLAGNVTCKERLNRDGEVYSAATLRYDALGRLAGVTIPSGATASITQYDAFDRPTSFEHFDGTVHTLGYAEHSSHPLIASVIATFTPENGTPVEHVLGRRRHDGLGRVVETTVDGVTRSFDYEAGKRRPSRSVNGRRQATLFDFVPALNDRPRRIAAFTAEVPVGGWDSGAPRQSDVSFTYAAADDPDGAPLGGLKRADSGTGSYDYVYAPDGMLDATTQAVQGSSLTVTCVERSLQGKLRRATLGDRSIAQSYDALGRPATTDDGDLRIEIVRDPFGRVHVERVIVAGSTAQETTILYDDHGRERHRTIDDKASGDVTVLETTFDVDDRLETRVVTRNGDTARESFTYTARGRLHTYAIDTASSALLPRNTEGLAITGQTWSYDPLDNITGVTTTFADGGTDVASYHHNGQRLTQIRHGSGGPSIDIGYDDDGNLASLGALSLTYSVSGRLASRDGIAYTHDAFDRIQSKGDTHRFYAKEAVVSESTGARRVDLVRSGGVLVAEREGAEARVFGTDHKHSVLAVTTGGARRFTLYTPSGEGENGARAGFSGALRDIGAGGYPLGHGTRLYLPGISAFSSIDTFTPFSGGGVHPYRYCNGDPVNRIDPSGHMSEGAQIAVDVGFLVLDIFALIAGIAAAIPTGGASLSVSVGSVMAIAGATAGIVSSVLGISSSAMEISARKSGEDVSDTTRKLDIASSAFGLISMATGAAEQGAKGVAKRVEGERLVKQGGGLKRSNAYRKGDPRPKDAARKLRAEGRQLIAESKEMLEPKNFTRTLVLNLMGIDAGRLSQAGKSARRITLDQGMIVLGVANRLDDAWGMATTPWSAAPDDSSGLGGDKYGLPDNP